MKKRVKPEPSLIDFKTIHSSVERRIRRRRSRSTPSTVEVVMEEPLSIDGGFAAKTDQERKESSTYEGENLPDGNKQDDVSKGGPVESLYKLGEFAMEARRGQQQEEVVGSRVVEEGELATGSKLIGVNSRLSKYSSLKRAASKWINFTSTKRGDSHFLKTFEKLNLRQLFEDGFLKNKVTEISHSTGFLDEDIDGYTDGPRQSIDEVKQQKMMKSKELVHYFATLAKDRDGKASVDLDYVERLLRDGTDPNACDKYGQTVLHEVARIWHPDVARFFIEHGAAVDKVDKYGRSSLHVAAAVDYSEMVECLLSCGADIHLRTFGENQTPVHYAAKNDACSSLMTLLRSGASIDDRDFKERTPLQLGAELDRSEACRILLNEGAPAGVWDDSGMSCMSLMILKMPPVALEALDQFHVKDRANRKQYYYLNFLERPLTFSSTGAKSSLKVAVEENQFSIIMHPVMQRLVEVKWNWFGKIGACFHFAVNLLFCIIWTALMCTLPNDVKDHHSPLPQMSYLIVLEIFVTLILFYWIIAEFREYRNSIRERHEFIRWREDELTRDIQYCHPRWPEERAYIEREIAELAELKPSYLVDWWNYFDWFTYAFIFSTILCHIVTISKQSSDALSAEKAVGSIMLVLQWIRLMKFVRAFKALGPFVVILRHVISDTGRFAFLFFIFYIPYAAALWVLFGKQSVTGYSNFEELAYNLLQITVVGDFGFTDLAKTHARMARLLCGTYIVFSGIVCLNLFIALLSDTFQRVYDNVQANAQMLRAARVLNFEDNFSRQRRDRYLKKVNNHCSPEISYYDDDMTGASETELKRMTQQIKTEVDSLKEYLHQKFGPPENETTMNRACHGLDNNDADSAVNSLKREIDLLKHDQEHSMRIINMQLLTINSMLADIASKKKRRSDNKRGLGNSKDLTSPDNTNGSGKVVRVAPILFDNGNSIA